MKMKKFLAVFLAMAMMLALVACGGNNSSANSGNGAANNSGNAAGDSGNETSGGTVKIGLVTAVTGSNSLVGEEATEAANLAISEINAAGGVNGQQLELVITD